VLFKGRTTTWSVKVWSLTRENPCVYRWYRLRLLNAYHLLGTCLLGTYFLPGTWYHLLCAYAK